MLRVTSSSLLRSAWDAGDRTCVESMQDKHPIHCTISQALLGPFGKSGFFHLFSLCLGSSGPEALSHTLRNFFMKAKAH